MIDYGRVKGDTMPKDFEITKTSVIITSNVQEYESDYDGKTIHGYEYDYVIYDKDEYITTMLLANKETLNNLSEELEATKIILGVE